jgi:spermidine synthase
VATNQALTLWLEDLHADQVGLKLRLRDCLFSQTSPFQRIAVYDSFTFGRVLTLGGTISITDFDERIYSECLAHPALSASPEAASVLILGGGDGGVAREALRYESISRVVVVEIDKQVVETCRTWFPAAAAGLADKRVELVIDDAHRYLRDCKQQFDVIIVDACELVNPASDAFHALPFAQTVFRCLKPNGVLIAPLGSPWYDGDACRTTLRALTDKFSKPRTYLMPLPSQPSGSLAVAWCTNGDAARTAIMPQAWHKDLKCWRPELNSGMFALAGAMEKQLGA